MKTHLVLSERWQVFFGIAAKALQGFLTVLNVTVTVQHRLDVVLTCTMYQLLLISKQSQETCGFGLT